MKTLAEFTKTTLIGGVLIILPIYVAVLLLAKAVNGLMALLAPVTAQIPAGVEFRQIIAILVLIAICFVVGLVVRTGPGLRAKNAFEQAVLEKLPGYTFLRGLAKRLTGRSEEHTLEPALVEIEDALVPALIVEELEDGSYTVLVPSAPTPMAGSIYILPRDRVHPVDIPFTKAMGVILEVGYRGRRVRARDEERRRGSAGRALTSAGQVLTAVAIAREEAIMFRAIPFLAIIVIAYNVIALVAGPALRAAAMSATLPSEAAWTLTAGDLLVLAGVCLLFLE